MYSRLWFEFIRSVVLLHSLLELRASKFRIRGFEFELCVLQELRAHLQREGRVWKEDCLEIIRKVTEITSNEPNLLRLNDPITGRV